MEPAWKRVDCRLAITDSPVGEQPERVRCPNPDHRDPNPSASVYADHLYCYGCRFHLRRMKTLAFLLYGRYDEGAAKEASKVANRYIPAAVDAYRARVEESVKTDPLPFGLAQAYKSLLLNTRKDRLTWLWDRGLKPHMVDYFVLGHDGTRFTVPVFSPDGQHLLTIRYRRDDHYGLTQFDPHRGEDRPIPKYSGMQGRNGLFLFTYPDVRFWEWAVVVEGELDAVRLWQEGIPAISPTNGAGNVARVPALIKRDYPGITHLVFATDQDEPGTAASFEGVAAAIQEGFCATRLSWDETYKDVTELYQGGYTLEDANHDGDELPFRLHQPVYRPA